MQVFAAVEYTKREHLESAVDKMSRILPLVKLMNKLESMQDDSLRTNDEFGAKLDLF